MSIPFLQFKSGINIAQWTNVDSYKGGLFIVVKLDPTPLP